MSNFAQGFWGTVDNSLQFVGKGTARLLTRKSATAEDVAYAALGGSIICALFGAIAGFGLSEMSRGAADLSTQAASVQGSMAAVEGAIIGLLLGACVGVFFGSLVEAVDEHIRTLLGSPGLKQH